MRCLLAARKHPERPLIGAGAVIVRGDEVVLVRRGREPRKGEWSVPGGLVKLGESLRQAAQREALEETGLQVEAREVVEVFESITPDSEGKILYHYIVVDFLCRIIGGGLRAGGDASEARWVKRTEFSALGMQETTLRALEKAMGMARPSC